MFGALGAVVLGLGVILLFAYNWAAMSRGLKFALILTALCGSHGAALWFWMRQPSARALAETLSVVGTMMFGAGIWLVAQMYHIDEHFPTGFLLWGAGAFGLAWTLRSIPQAIIAAVVLTIWGCSEFVGFDSPVGWAGIGLLSGLLPLAWERRSRVLWGLLLLSGPALIVASAVKTFDLPGLVWLGGLSWAVFYLGLARVIDRPSAPPGFAAAAEILGYTGFLFCTFVLSFAEGARAYLRMEGDEGGLFTMASGFAGASGVAAFGSWLWVAIRLHRRALRRLEFLAWIPVLTLGVAWLCFLLARDQHRVEVAVIFNVAALALAIGWIQQGCRDGRLRPVTLGVVVAGVFLFARYFDLFESLAARGLVFVVFGSGLIAAGFAVRRSRARVANELPTAGGES